MSHCLRFSLLFPGLRRPQVGFLLRQPGRISSEESALAVEKDAASGLMFLDRLAAAASRLGCLQGTLSRIILPFDA